MRDLEALLGKAKQGTITRAEVDAVAAELRHDPGATDAYTMLHVVGRSFATEHRSLVEGFLRADWDPMLARLSLQILCSFWGDTPRYLDIVREALRGIPWDVDDDVKQIAISISGEHLRGHKDLRLLGELFEIFSNENEERTIREGAYLALARANGREWKDVPPASRHFDLDADIDQSVISEVRRALQER